MQVSEAPAEGNKMRGPDCVGVFGSGKNKINVKISWTSYHLNRFGKLRGGLFNSVPEVFAHR